MKDLNSEFLLKVLEELYSKNPMNFDSSREVSPSNSFLNAKLNNIREENLRLYRIEILEFYFNLSEEDRDAACQYVACCFGERMSYQNKYKLIDGLYMSIKYRPQTMINYIRKNRLLTIKKNSGWKSGWKSIALP